MFTDLLLKEGRELPGEGAGMEWLCVCARVGVCVRERKRGTERQIKSRSPDCRAERDRRYVVLTQQKAGALLEIKNAGRTSPPPPPPTHLLTRTSSLPAHLPWHKHKHSANEELARSRSLLRALPVLASFN